MQWALPTEVVFPSSDVLYVCSFYMCVRIIYARSILILEKLLLDYIRRHKEHIQRLRDQFDAQKTSAVKKVRIWWIFEKTRIEEEKKKKSHDRHSIIRTIHDYIHLCVYCLWHIIWWEVLSDSISCLVQIAQAADALGSITAPRSLSQPMAWCHDEIIQC